MTMVRGARLTAVTLILLVAWAQRSSASTTTPSAVVERVSVAVRTAVPLPDALHARIEASITVVAERIVLGRPVATVEGARDDCARVILEVFNRILTGYRIDQLSLEVGGTVRITAYLSPDGALVESVGIALHAPGLKDGGRALLQQSLALEHDRFVQVFRGVPVAALSWALPLLAPLTEEALQEEYPGFRAVVVFRESGNPVVELSLSPGQPAVEEILLELSSDTLPRFLVGLWRRRAWGCLADLEGLPVAFVRRWQARIEQYITGQLAADPFLSRWRLQWETRMQPGTTTRVKILAEAEHYSFNIRGHLQITDPAVLGLSLRASVLPLPGWELAGEALADTTGSGLDFSGSLIGALAPELTIGLTQTTREKERRLWLCYASERGDRFIVSGDLVSAKLAATVGFSVENQLLMTFTVDSRRRYYLAVQLEL